MMKNHEATKRIGIHHDLNQMEQPSKN